MSECKCSENPDAPHKSQRFQKRLRADLQRRLSGAFWTAENMGLVPSIFVFADTCDGIYNALMTQTVNNASGAVGLDVEWTDDTLILITCTTGVLAVSRFPACVRQGAAPERARRIAEALTQLLASARYGTHGCGIEGDIKGLQDLLPGFVVDRNYVFGHDKKAFTKERTGLKAWMAALGIRKVKGHHSIDPHFNAWHDAHMRSEGVRESRGESWLMVCACPELRRYVLRAGRVHVVAARVGGHQIRGAPARGLA